MLLSVDEPADALMSFLSRRASMIARAMFEVSSPFAFPCLPHSLGLLRSTEMTQRAPSTILLGSLNLSSACSLRTSMKESLQMGLLR
jgi:hypothetical protein